MNVTCIQIHSIILSVTCHGLRKLSPTHTHPLKTIHEFLTPYQLLFFELESLIKCWCELHENSLNNFICHLSWFKKLSRPLIHIPSKPFMNFWHLTSYFFELESLIKCWMWIAWKFTSIILSVTCHSLRNFLPLTHIPLYPLVNFWNPMGWSGSIHGWGGVEVGHTGVGWGWSCSKTT